MIFAECGIIRGIDIGADSSIERGATRMPAHNAQAFAMVRAKQN